eukprot:2935295-Pyramimonas_sp.AAC.1
MEAPLPLLPLLLPRPASAPRPPPSRPTPRSGRPRPRCRRLPRSRRALRCGTRSWWTTWRTRTWSAIVLI